MFFIVINCLIQNLKTKEQKNKTTPTPKQHQVPTYYFIPKINSFHQHYNLISKQLYVQYNLVAFKLVCVWLSLAKIINPLLKP